MQFVIVACALLGVALAQYPAVPAAYAGNPAAYAGYNPAYAGYPGLKGYPGTGYPGTGFPGTGFPNYQGYGAYPGYAGYGPYKGFPGPAPGLVAVKPVDSKDKDAKPVVVPALPKAPIVPLPAVPFVPGAPAKAYAGPYAAIRSQINEASSDGTYRWSYETENGIAAAESGSPGRSTPEGTEEVVVGEYAYTSPEGIPVHVRYTADADGFHPEIISPSYDGYYGTARSALPVNAAGLPVVPIPVVKAVEVKKESEAEKKEE